MLISIGIKRNVLPARILSLFIIRLITFPFHSNRDNNGFIRRALVIAFFSLFPILSSFSQEDFTKYIDPTIGNVAQFLVPTYPTMLLPNQMIRMFPVKQDYLSDKVDAFPVQVVSHRSAGLLQMEVITGYFSGYDYKVHESTRPFYVDDCIWDTYRAQHPLRTILDPQMENDILNSYTLMYEQSGWMPTFPQICGNHMCNCETGRCKMEQGTFKNRNSNKKRS